MSYFINRVISGADDHLFFQCCFEELSHDKLRVVRCAMCVCIDSYFQLFINHRKSSESHTSQIRIYNTKLKGALSVNIKNTMNMNFEGLIYLHNYMFKIHTGALFIEKNNRK